MPLSRVAHDGHRRRKNRFAPLAGITFNLNHGEMTQLPIRLKLMILFPEALAAWNSAAFNATIKDEIEHLDVDLLPLEQGLSRSSHVSADRVGATILRVEEENGRIRVKAGLLYAGIIAGCACADDPTPEDELAEYCEVWFDINAATGEAEVSPVTDADG